MGIDIDIDINVDTDVDVDVPFRLQEVGIWGGRMIGVLLSLRWSWRTVMFQLSGFGCKP